MNIENLTDQNPWWRNPQAINNDIKIMEINKAKIKWVPRIKTFFQLDKDRIYTLRGPRQVGKTSLIKLIIKDLIRKSINPRRIFYFTCDIIFNEQELVDVINDYIEFSSGLDPSERKYMFIDEISSVKNWEKAIKYLVDTGKLNNSTLILTGSHSIDIKYSTERLPGRRGEGRGGGPLNKILVPMKFSEYVETVNPELRNEMSDFFYLKKEKRYKILFGLFEGTIEPKIREELIIFQKDLKRLLDNYLLTGGVIRAIEDFYKNKQIDSTIYEIYIKSLIGDLAKWKFQENIAKQIIRSTITKLTSRVSLNSIAKENEIGSHNTVSSYLTTLENSYVLNILYEIELQSRLANFKRERKIYFIDPFIFHALRGWILGNLNYFELSKHYLLNEIEKSKLIEMVVSGHLIRLAYNLHLSDVFSHHEHLFFWKKKRSDHEVDFVFKHDNDLYPIEVKYQNTIKRRDLSNLFSMRKGILVSKQTLEKYNQYSIIPIEIFLMLI